MFHYLNTIHACSVRCIFFCMCFTIFSNDVHAWNTADTHNLPVKYPLAFITFFHRPSFNFNFLVYFHSKVECKKSKACFAAKNHRAHSRDIPVGGHHDPHSRDVPVHREVHRGVVRRGRTFSLGGLINQFLRNLF